MRVRSLTLLVGGQLQELLAQAMPRLDFFRSLHPGLDPYETDGLERDPDSEADPLLLSYRSGFWGLAKLLPGAEEHPLGLHATFEDGREAVVGLGTVRRAHCEPTVDRRDAAVGAAEVAAEVAICMATFNPPRELFARQVESLRAQTFTDWVCYVSDDHSSEQGFEVLREVIADDDRFVVSRAPSRLGFYRNFERALKLAPAQARFVALADQDDVWHPDKLETLVDEIGSAQLVYSDARIVARDGHLIADTYWSRRENNHSDLTSMLVANAVTGAASLMRRDVLSHALPFPPRQFSHYHDHWIGLVALALGEIKFVRRPLYDYVQHRDAALSHAAATRMTPLLERLLSQRAPRDRVRQWRLHYFADVCRLLQVATILKLRCGEKMDPPKRRALDRFLAGERPQSPSSARSLAALGALAARGGRELMRDRPQTLGAEWMLFHAFAWRRLLAASARERPQRRLRLDAVPPPALILAPTRTGLPSEVADMDAKIAPLELAIADAAPRRVNLLIPTIDLEHFFGGYIAKFNLALALARRGLRVRIVTVDPGGPLPPDWRTQIESYTGLGGFFEQVEVAFGRGPEPVEVSSSDKFIASTWWSAHIAAAAMQELGGGPFVYLIQEYEPFTFTMGSYAALAEQSYRFEHFALFSTELLREYFRRHRIGVYAASIDDGDTLSESFQNAITPVVAPSVEELRAREGRRLLFYARPEQHAARNMFELGLLALSRLAADGVLTGWELNGIGATGPARRIDLGGASALALLPRSGQSSYAELLVGHDVGLALMYTPHPSLVPIEMAAAGMLTVTNSFEHKTQAALAAIAGNLIAAEPTVDGIASALREAIAAAEDYERRVRGSEVRWSMSWEESLSDALVDRLTDALGWTATSGRVSAAPGRGAAQALS